MEKYEQVNVHGYEEFCRAVAERTGKDIFVYFSGDKDEQGKSWCPDCVQAHGNQKSSISDYWNISFLQCRNVQLPAEPVVRKEMAFLPEGSVFIYCQVGDRPYWKDPSNDFKKTLKLTGVPTLIRYGTPQKLVEEQCFKPELVRMMFTED